MAEDGEGWKWKEEDGGSMKRIDEDGGLRRMEEDGVRWIGRSGSMRMEQVEGGWKRMEENGEDWRRTGRTGLRIEAGCGEVWWDGAMARSRAAETRVG